MSDTAFSWVLSIFTDAWAWLGTYNYHGVPLANYLIGFLILSIIVRRIFG